MIFGIEHLRITAPKMRGSSLDFAVDDLDIEHVGSGRRYAWSPGEFIALTALGERKHTTYTVRLAICRALKQDPAIYGCMLNNKTVFTTNDYMRIVERINTGGGWMTVLTPMMIPEDEDGRAIVRQALKAVL